MITGTEGKGYGLIVALKEAGISIAHAAEGTVVREGVEALAQDIVDTYSVDDAQTFAKSRVDAQAKEQRDLAVRSHSVGEIALWSVKEAEANAYDADNSAPTPQIDSEASFRGLTKADLVAKILAKSAQYHAVDGAVWARTQALKDAIDAASTFAEVNAVEAQIPDGWPL